MTQLFRLDPSLAGNPEIVDLPLCKVTLVDNILFPWLILIPRKNDIKEIIDLRTQEQQILMEEIVLVSKVAKQIFKPDKLNVAALGNIVPQLHIHIVARFTYDKAWPHPVFGKETQHYNNKLKEKIIKELRKVIEESMVTT